MNPSSFYTFYSWERQKSTSPWTMEKMAGQVGLSSNQSKRKKTLNSEQYRRQWETSPRSSHINMHFIGTRSCGKQKLFKLGNIYLLDEWLRCKKRKVKYNRKNCDIKPWNQAIKKLFECYGLSSSQKNNGQFCFDCEERKERKRK